MDEQVLARKFALMLPHLDERQRRLWLGAEAQALGRGGVSAVARAAAVSRPTVRRGLSELAEGAASGGRVRQLGAGHKRMVQLDPELSRSLDRMVDRIHERQHFGHLRGLTTPRRHDRAREPDPLTRLRVPPPGVDARRPDVDTARTGRDPPRPGMPVADHQPIAVLVELVRERLDVRVDFGLKRRRSRCCP